MKTFDNEWILQAFEDHPTFFTKRMFGGLAVYLFGRQMMLLVEPTMTGRWKWHGVLICTDRAQHADFEPVLERVASAIARNDSRFGIHPRPRKDRQARPA